MYCSLVRRFFFFLTSVTIVLYLFPFTYAEYLDVSSTYLVDPHGVIKDTFCNPTVNPNLLTEIWADCGTSTIAANVTMDSSSALNNTTTNTTNTTTIIECPCCFLCFDDIDDTILNANYDVRCQINANYFERVGGKFYDPSRNTTCTCSDSPNPNITSAVLSCNDDGGYGGVDGSGKGCPTCNHDGTICAINVDYGYIFDTYGVPIGYKNTFQYISDGFNNTNTTLMYYYRDSSCVVSINDQQCQFCEPIRCQDDFNSLYVDCTNVVVVEEEDDNDVNGVGIVSLCEKGMDEESIFGNALTVFAAADVRFRSGCEPLYLDVVLNDLLL